MVNTPSYDPLSTPLFDSHVESINRAEGTQGSLFDQSSRQSSQQLDHSQQDSHKSPNLPRAHSSRILQHSVHGNIDEYEDDENDEDEDEDENASSETQPVLMSKSSRSKSSNKGKYTHKSTF